MGRKERKMLNFNQISFTRVSGQGSNDGWKNVNISSGVSGDSAASFSRFQNGNIIPPDFDDEDRNSQMVTELQTDGKNAFYTRIKCNASVDDRGRSIMFANSFVFDLNEFVHDPQSVLRISDGNYRFTMEETAEVPAKLELEPGYGLKECVESLGMDEQKYCDLIQCVYQTLEGKTKNSLHIICDCRHETIMKYMTCIYLGVPFEFRKKISFSTYEFQNGLVKTIIFDRRQKGDGSLYIEPASGDNNMLTDMVRKRLSKFEFIRIAPTGYQTESGFDDEFRKIEDKLAEFGSEQTTSLELYKIAYDLVKDENDYSEHTPEQLRVRLNEFLSAPVSHVFIDRQIEYTLGEIIEKNIEINDVLSEKLSRRISTSRCDTLIDTGNLYTSARILRMGVEDGAAFLRDSDMDRSSRAFGLIRQKLSGSEHGSQILDEYYSKYVIDPKNSQMEEIVEFYEETKDLRIRYKTRRTIEEACSSYVKVIVNEEKSPADIMDRVTDLISGALDSNDREASKRLAALTRSLFWEKIRYEDFDIEDCNNYYKLCEEGNKKCRAYMLLTDAVEMFEKNKGEKLSETMKELFSSPVTLPVAQRAGMIDKFMEACLRRKDMVDKYNIDIWMIAADYLVNPPEFLIENRIIPMGIDYFERAFIGSGRFKNTKYCETYLGYLSEYIQRKTPLMPVAQNAVSVIKNGMKRARQEEKRQKHEEAREAKDIVEKGNLGFFRGILDKVNKNKKDE